MTVFSRLTLFARVLALVTLAHGNIMVRSMDGSFVPFSFVRRAGTGPVGVRLTNNNDQSYITPVLMGTPPQTVEMAPSLSQNFISVASPPTGVNDQSYYNPSVSSSYKPGVGTATTQTISGGTVQGSYVGEICTLQSSNTDTPFTYNASVVVTNSAVTNDLYPVGSRGVLGYGLAAPKGSPNGTSLVGTFLPATFTHAACGIELNHKDDPVPDGVLMMGTVDPTAFTGNFSNVAVPSTSPVSWSVPFDGLTYYSNGASQTMAGMLASVDMYHTGIQITSSAAAQLYAGVPGAQALSSNLWAIPCTSKFPITLTFGGTPFAITERDTIVKQADGSCTGVVTGGAQAIGKVGAPFMRNVYTQFFADVASDGTMTFGVGFATKNLRLASAPASSSTHPPQQTVRPTATAAAAAQSTTAASQSTAGANKSSGSRLNFQEAGFSLKVAMILAAAIAFTLGS